MLSEVRRLAQAADCPTVIVTFDPHPITVLRPEIRLPRLSSISTRTALLKDAGADAVVVLPVGTGLLHMQPREFFDEVIVHELEAAGIVEGEDFHFGKDRAGNCEVLAEYCSGAGIPLHVFPPVRADERLISSTRIRAAIESGQIDQAVNLLGHEYTITGVVGRGAGRGASIGIPTANLDNVPELLPPPGVYCGSCELEGQRWPTAVNIGGNPTFAEQQHKVECHVIGFDGNLYGSELTLALCRRLRDVISFESADALVRQIRDDIASCRDCFTRDQVRR